MSFLQTYPVYYECKCVHGSERVFISVLQDPPTVFVVRECAVLGCRAFTGLRR